MNDGSSIAAWLISHKMITSLSVILLAFFVSTIVLGSQKSNLTTDLDDCLAKNDKLAQQQQAEKPQTPETSTTTTTTTSTTSTTTQVPATKPPVVVVSTKRIRKKRYLYYIDSLS